MATTKLALYNGALRILGERKLASLTENREPRRVLDGIWDAGAQRYCLEQGQWDFAMRTAAIDYTASITPSFGYQRAFEKPSDFVRLCGMASDEYFNSPLTAYTDEAGYWFADLDVLYVRYISDDTSYGLDLSLWPETFIRYVETYLAAEACMRIMQNQTAAERLEQRLRKRLTDARSKDAMGGPAQFMPQGSWSRARTGGGWYGRERGRP